MNSFDSLLSVALEPWHFEFIRRGIIALTLIALCSGALGAHVVLRRLAFIGDGLAHATFGGLAVGFLLKINLLLSAAAAAIFTALGIGFVNRKADVSLDTSVGIMFTGTFAAGIAILSHDRGFRGDLFDLFLGNVLTVDATDLWFTVWVSALVILCLVGFHKEFLYASFDSAGAAAAGIPVNWLDFMLLALIAITITAALHTVGVILVSALLVTPAASAIQLTDRFGKMMILSSIFGIAAGIAGIYISYFLDVPAGAAVVLSATALFFASLLAGRKRSRVRLPAPSVEAQAAAIEGHFHSIP